MQAVVGCSEVAVRLVAHHGATQLSVYYGPQLCAQGKREGGGVGQTTQQSETPTHHQ